MTTDPTEPTPTILVRIGDYGGGTPLQVEIDSCQHQSHGEMIFDPSPQRWTCEPTSLPNTGNDVPPAYGLAAIFCAVGILATLAATRRRP